MRQRRIDILGRSFSGEPPFIILVALYSAEDREPLMTVTRLTELAWLTTSTTLRWIDQLADAGWISRTSVPADRRKVRLGLTDKARSALRELFGTDD